MDDSSSLVATITSFAAAGSHERVRAGEPQLEPLGVAVGQELCGALTQTAERAEITALLGTARRPREARRRAPRELVQPRIGAVELGSVAVGALEVVAHDLVLLDKRCVHIEPDGKGLVELGSRPLGERVVRGVPDQEVAEAVGLLVGVDGLVRADQLLPHEREEMGGDVVALARRRELLHRPAVEDLPFDGAAADHVPLARAEPVEPGLQERLDRRRHHDLRLAAVLAHHREHLLDEERVPVGGLQDSLAHVVGDLRSTGEPRHQHLTVRDGERLEQDRRRIELAAAPAGPELEQLGAGDAQQEDRCVP